MRFYLQFLSLSFVAVFLCSSFAFAQAPALLKTSKNWSSYHFQENGKAVCYMVSKPLTDEGNYTRRGEIFALVTHRPSERSKNVFSYITGYTYKPGSDVRVTIDGQTFLLFTQDDTAWAPDAETDQRIAAAIRSGSKMVVKGTSSRGTVTTDTFSLSGSSAAHGLISKKCGY